MNRVIKIYFDGGSRPNPGEMETAVVVRGNVHHKTGRGTGSSEMAEWLALLDAVEIAQALGIPDALFLGDSAAVVGQANGLARPRSASARAMHARFVEGTAGFTRLRVRRIKREQNLAGIALEQVRQKPQPPKERPPE